MVKIVKNLQQAIVPAVALAVVSGLMLPVRSQERQGCFMVNAAGRFIDLSEICPAPQRVLTPTATPQLGTGDIQVTLRWATSDDLDLAVTDPRGDIVSFSNPTITSGGKLDVDANAGCQTQTQTPIENIFWPPGQAPQGNYSVSVNLFARCNSSGSIPFTLTLLVQGTTETLTGTVTDQNPVVTFPFSLPRQPQPGR
ncbi:MAG: hypothetical protein IGS50_21520 [Synechococcales cyanobacterium C42_A2020_086]|jgi:hypothetical protein|nr:hypothetical protein [Synechococcales cyanobacterium C42_A2020_086]